MDKKEWPNLKRWLEIPKNRKKFNLIVKQLLDQYIPPSRDLYDKEDFDNQTKGVTAMKPFKGKDNPRIYCKELTITSELGGVKKRVIIASELLRKKTNTKGLSNKERQIIRRVALKDYDRFSDKVELCKTI